VYFGTDPTASTLFASNLALGPSETTSQFQQVSLPTLQAGTTYYWKVVSKTAAMLSRTGAVWSFTTAGTPPPPPPPPPHATTIVLWSSGTPAGNLHGHWSMLSDASASGGAALWNPDAGQSKISPALANPSNYFERSFTAYRGVAYHLWVRMRAQSNSLGNDSVHVQFNQSVDSGGSATWRIGTASSAEIVLQNGPNDPSDSGWGWSENGWGSLGPHIYFGADGPQTLRVQQREDGAIVDEIVLSPGTYLTTAPGPRDNDATILTEDDGSGSQPPPPPPPPTDTVVVWAAHVAPGGITGTRWQSVSDATAAGGAGVWNPDMAQAKISPALSSPASFVELTFNAKAGTAYHLWVRMRAQNDSFSNDSVHVQFNDSVTISGAPTMQIGTTSSAECVLQNGPSGSADHGWGWSDNGWGALGVNVYFAADGQHRLRIQQREDGPTVDQIVLSPTTYLSSPPGPRQNDATILPENPGS
jgi:hypothetical protein